MDISNESKTAKLLPSSPCTDYISHEITKSDQEPSYYLLAQHLVQEWMNQALDNYELTHGDIQYQSGTSAPHCETSIGSCTNETQVCINRGDVLENSVPTLKQLCCKVLETSGNRLMKLSVGQSCAEEKQKHGKCRNGTEMNWRSLSCSLLARNIPNKQLRYNKLCADTIEFNGNMHVREVGQLSHSKSIIRHTKSETFLQCITNEVDIQTGNHSEHLEPNSLRVHDVPNLQNILSANSGNTENCVERNACKVLQNVDAGDKTVNQIEAPVDKLLSTSSLENVSPAVTNTFSADVNANFDCMSAVLKQTLIKSDVSSQDPCDSVECRITRSSSDTILSEDWNSTDDGCQIIFSRPAVQVSFISSFIALECF